MREKTERILITALLVCSVIFGFAVTEPFAVTLYGCLCVAVSLFYIMAGKVYERSKLVKVASFIAITISAFSFYGLALTYTEAIDRLILSSGYEKSIKIFPNIMLFYNVDVIRHNDRSRLIYLALF